MVRACRPPERDPASSWLVRRSTMATSTPASASSPANISPVGPPPAITTACSFIATLLLGITPDEDRRKRRSRGDHLGGRIRSRLYGEWTVRSHSHSRPGRWWLVAMVTMLSLMAKLSGGAATLLWIIAVILVIAGIVTLFRGGVLAGIVLIILGFAVGPG